MTNLTMIVAASENNVIGLENAIPWKIPADLKRFAQLTTGHPVIMGRKTYESLPPKFRPLPKRENIVLSTTMAPSEGLYVARTVDEALQLTEGRDAYVIGGSIVYDLFLSNANKIELTRVHRFMEGDAFLPEINWAEWELANEEKYSNVELPYSFLSYMRK